MLFLKKVLLAAIAFLLALATLAGIFVDLSLPMPGLTGVNLDMYRIQVCLAFLCSAMGTCTYITIRKIYELSPDLSRWKNKDKMSF